METSLDDADGLVLCQGYTTFLFRNESCGEHFLLILSALRERPNVDVLVREIDKRLKNFESPDTREVSFLSMNSLLGQPDTRDQLGADRWSGPLQGKHFLSVTLERSPTSGRKHYFVDMKFTELLSKSVSVDQKVITKTIFSRRLLRRT